MKENETHIKEKANINNETKLNYTNIREKERN